MVDEPLIHEINYPKNLNIIYNQPIEGYRLKIICDPFEGSDAIQAMMEFQNERTGAKFAIFNDWFYVARSPYDSLFEKFIEGGFEFEDTIFLDCEVDSYYTNRRNTIGNYIYNAPFCLLDIDFDGEKELAKK